MAIIDKPTDYFNTVLYTGTGSTQSITGLDFQPDLVWWKSRGAAQDHQWYDVIRGVTKAIESNKTTAEYTQSNGLTSFNSDGFTVGDGTAGNASGDTFASWNWKAGGTASSNTDGSITSSVSANQDAGFSIVSYSGNLSNIGVATVGHGLGVAPQMIIIKNTNNTADWGVLHTGLTSFNYLIELNTTDAEVDKTGNGSMSAPTTTVFSTNYTNALNVSGRDYIAYCFAEKQGYSKFGSYTGNGSTDGTFVYTGFKPAWVMVKRTDGARNWVMCDNKRDTFNVVNNQLYADLSNAEESAGSGLGRDFLSNGFKQRGIGAAYNASGGSYIFMAFAENPFVTSTGVPATAR